MRCCTTRSDIAIAVDLNVSQRLHSDWADLGSSDLCVNGSLLQVVTLVHVYHMYKYCHRMNNLI